MPQILAASREIVVCIVFIVFALCITFQWLSRASPVLGARMTELGDYVSVQ